MTTYLALDPVDVLAMRGNRLFADGYGDSQMPPWPSVVAGALRTRILVDAGVSFADFRAGVFHGGGVKDVIGTWEAPGSFRVTFLGLHFGDEIWVAMPSDLVGVQEDARVRLTRLEPVAVQELGVSLGGALPWVPVPRQSVRAKALGGLWLSAMELGRHLEGAGPDGLTPRRSSSFWRVDPRLGIALDGKRRTVREGLIYTTETLAFEDKAGLVVGVDGANGVLPSGGLVRLGGDGHAARVSVMAGVGPIGGKEAIGPRFRLVLSTPGLFEGGWVPTGVVKEGEHYVLRHEGFAARLMAAAVPRYEVVSGWDLKARKPKPAVRVVPAGAVYWFEQVEGGEAERRAWAGRVLGHGLWEPTPAPDRRRRQSEGFNNVWLGSWAQQAS